MFQNGLTNLKIKLLDKMQPGIDLAKVSGSTISIMKLLLL